MTTSAQLSALAKKSGFHANMERKGFKHSKKSKMLFYRKNSNDIYQIICLHILTGGENVKIAVFNWVPELHESYDIEQFPKDLKITNGGFVTSMSDIGMGSRLWDLRNHDDIGATLNEISTQIDQVAIPWLNRIETRSDLIATLFVDIKNNSRFKKLSAKILKPSK